MASEVSAGITHCFLSFFLCYIIYIRRQKATMGKNDYTGLLYAEPSLLEGFARVLDVGGVFDDFNYSPTPEQADRLALISDWYAVGADLHRAISRYLADKIGAATHVGRSSGR